MRFIHGYFLQTKQLNKINLIIGGIQALEPKCCRNFLDPTCTWKYCMSKTAINVDVSTSENFKVHLSNQESDHPGSYRFLAHLFTLFQAIASVFKIALL